MNRRITVEVSNKKDAAAMQRALTRSDIRAFVVMIGYLDALPNDRARTRVLRYVENLVSDPDHVHASLTLTTPAP